jgi:proteasome lid subunit RPN8/RPN11
MLTLVLPADIARKLQDALARSEKREIGGVMMAEHVAVNTFVVRDLTIHRRGTFASFIRRIEEALATLTRFFESTRRNYERFNYIGEWHSHPSFEPSPSDRDHRSMMEIILDRSVGANFIVLMIVKLSPQGALIGSVHTYLPDGLCERSKLVIEEAHACK